MRRMIRRITISEYDDGFDPEDEVVEIEDAEFEDADFEDDDTLGVPQTIDDAIRAERKRWGLR